MEFRIQVDVSVSRESGKFATREEITDAIVDALERAELSQIDGIGADGDSVYLVDDWSVAEVALPLRSRIRKA